MSPDSKHYIKYLEILQASTLFKGLDIKENETILGLMNLVKWRSGSFKSSLEASQTLHFIVSGRLKVYQINNKTGREHTIFILSKGDVFDIINLLDTEVHEVFWEALDDLEILIVSNQDIQQYIYKYPALNHSILRYLGKRMRMLEDVAIDSTIHNTITRLANLLLKNINGESKKLELINNLPNEEIASLIGTTRAVVNRHLQELKKAGAISVKRKQIDIENLNLLIAIAEDKYMV